MKKDVINFMIAIVFIIIIWNIIVLPFKIAYATGYCEAKGGVYNLYTGCNIN